MVLSPEIDLPTPTPAAYTTIEELDHSLERKGTPVPGPGLYPRDGEPDVTAIEEALSVVTVSDQRANVAISSGMAAVSAAYRFALSTAGEKRPDHRPVLAYAGDLYSQSTRSILHQKNIGLIATKFSSGDPEAIDELFDESRPDVLFAETVANTPQMPVLDLPRLLERIREDENGPILVLDNTLPLSTGIDFNALLKAEDRVLIVESGTKTAMHNSGPLGVVYSKNRELIDAFRKFKATEGLITGGNEAILQTLETTLPGFHQRNRALFASTNEIAAALARARKELGEATDFTIDFPTFPDHPNHQYAKERMPGLHVPKRVSPVVFITATEWQNDAAARDLLSRISGHPAVQEQTREGQIFFGQSFGFQQARLLYDPNALHVRVAGGYDIDSSALAKALYEAAVEK